MLPLLFRSNPSYLSLLWYLFIMSCFSSGCQGSADQLRLILSALRPTQSYLGFVIERMCEKAGDGEELSQRHQEQQMQRFFKINLKAAEDPFRGARKTLQWRHNGTQRPSSHSPHPLLLEEHEPLALDCCLEEETVSLPGL